MADGLNRQRLGAALSCIAILLFAPVWLADRAAANSTIQLAVQQLYGFTPTDCQLCHNSAPGFETEANAAGPLASAVAPFVDFVAPFTAPQAAPTTLAEAKAQIRIAVDNGFAPRFSGSALSLTGFSKASGSAPVTLANAGAFAFRGATTAYEPVVTRSDTRFTLSGSGVNQVLSVASAGALKDVFGNLPAPVTLTAVSPDGFFHSSLKTTDVSIALKDEPVTLNQTTYAQLLAGTATPQKIALDFNNPDQDTIAFSVVSASDNSSNPVGVSVNPTTGELSFTPPNPMPAGYSVDVSLQVEETQPGGSTNTLAVTLAPAPGTNTAPFALTRTFTLKEARSVSGVIACDIDTGNASVPCLASGPDSADTLIYRVNGAVVPKGVALSAAQSGLSSGAITIGNDNQFTYVGTSSNSMVDRTEAFDYTVSDGVAPPVAGKVTFTQTPIDNQPIVKPTAAIGNKVVDIAIDVVTDQSIPTAINLADYVVDDTPLDQLNYRILKYVDADQEVGGVSIPPRTYGTFTPTAIGVITGGNLSYVNVKNKALGFYIYFRVANAGKTPSSADCAAGDTDCGRVRVSVKLNGDGRHTPAQRLLLANQLGEKYQSIPGRQPNFPQNGDVACLNCHTAGRITTPAPNCNSSKFFNGLGQRICNIDPFNPEFARRLNEAIVGHGTELSFEPSVKLTQKSLTIPETANVGDAFGDEMTFTTGLDLDGRKSKILNVYLKGKAGEFFGVKITDDGGGGGDAKGRLVVRKKLSGFTGKDTIDVAPLPVNNGARRDRPGQPSEGFYPLFTYNPGEVLAVTIDRALPEVADDSFQINTRREPFELDVTANDTRDAIDSVFVVDQPSKGTVVSKGRMLVFTSDGSSTGTDTFTYKARRKGVGVSAEKATVTLKIFDRNDAVAQDDKFQATLGEAIDLPVQANDLGRKPFTRFELVAGSPPKLGTARISGDAITYTAAKTGTDVFKYSVTGGGVTTFASVTVVIGKVSGNILAAATGNKGLKPVARALGDTCQTLERKHATGDQRKLIGLCNDLVDDSARGQSIDQALDQIRNEETLVAGDAVQQHERAASANILGRLDNARGGQGRGLNFSQFNLQIDDNTISGALIDATLNKPSEQEAMAPKGDLPWGVFVAGNVNIASQDSSDREAGFDFSGVMLTAGIDYALDEKALIGLAVSGGQSITDAGSADNLTMQSVQLAGYGSVNITSNLYLDGYAGFALNRFDMDRNVAFSAGGQSYDNTAASAFNGESLSAALRLKYDQPLGEALLSTYGTLSYVAAWTDSYVEKGAGIYSMSVGEQNFDTLTATIGARLSGAITYDFGTLKPYIGASYARQLDSDKRSVRSTWAVAGGSGQSFILSTENDGDNFGGFELGFTAELLEGATVETGLSGSFSDSGFSDYTIRAALNIPLGAPPPPPEQAAPPKPAVTAPKKPAAPPAPTPPADGGGTSGGGGSPGGGGWN